MRICPRMSDNPLQPVADRAELGAECTRAGESDCPSGAVLRKVGEPPDLETGYLDL